MRITVYSDISEEESAIDDIFEEMEEVKAETETVTETETVKETSIETGLREYIAHHGWHFSEKLCRLAVKKMRKVGGAMLTPLGKEQVDTLLNIYGIVPQNASGYDVYYVANMARADYFGSSIVDDASLALFIRDYIDDVDGYKGKAFRHYYADCNAKGEHIPWADVI